MRAAKNGDAFVLSARLKAHEEAVARLTKGIALYPEAASGLSKCLAHISEQAEVLRLRIGGARP